MTNPTFTENQLLEALQMGVKVLTIGTPEQRKAMTEKLNESDAFRYFVYASTQVK